MTNEELFGFRVLGWNRPDENLVGGLLSIEDAFSIKIESYCVPGSTGLIRVPSTYIICESCKGSGKDHGSDSDCYYCDGYRVQGPVEDQAEIDKLPSLRWAVEEADRIERESALALQDYRENFITQAESGY